MLQLTLGLDSRLDPAAPFAARLEALLRRPPTGREVDAFSKYLSLLLQWNRVYSLTAYREPVDIIEKLLLDSLLFLPLLPIPPCQVLDLGSGVGIPGIPLKIVEPRLSLTLVEARRRRASFLVTLVRELQLEGVRVLGGRAEVLIKEIVGLEGSFDVVVARAFGPLRALLPIALKFLRPGGRVIASGPPFGKEDSSVGESGIRELVVSPLSGQPRQFLVFEKK